MFLYGRESVGALRKAYFALSLLGEAGVFRGWIHACDIFFTALSTFSFVAIKVSAVVY